MASIIVEIPGIVGETTTASHENQLAALGLRETLEVLATQTAGNTGAGGAARAKHSDIQLTRYRDKASPKLAEACSAATDLGTVKIKLFRPLSTGAAVYMQYELEHAYVARVEWETLDENKMAFMPHLHLNTKGAPLPTSQSGIASLVAADVAGQTESTRAAPRPLFAMQRGPETSNEVERVWLNATQVKWAYTPYVGDAPGGAIVKTFNILTSAEV